ncbi:MAG: CtrA inhibitor SciP [Sphingomicrobium sp.]
MLENQSFRPACVIGPLGERLTLDDLPPADTTRWVVRRKATVVAAVDGGLLTIAEACERYDLALEEFASWQRAVERSGMAGLRTTKLQHYRDLYERQVLF